MAWIAQQLVEAVLPAAVETARDRTEATKCMDTNHSNFKKKIDTLRAVRDDLKDRSTKYKLTMKWTLDDWFHKVNKVEKDAKELENCFSAIKETSPWNPFHSGSRINLSKKMTTMCPDIDELIMGGKELWNTLVHKAAERVLKMTAPDISYIPSQQDILNQILQHLPNENNRAIRVLGMSGTGKTTILKNLNNHETVADLYERVIWVTVSDEANHKENLSIKMLQYGIAERLMVLDSEGATDIARKIKEELEGVKFLLLLDDVKEEPDLDMIGIPEGAKGSKIVMTTKFRHVMLPLCYNIEVKKLSESDSWSMFLKLLALPNDVKEKPQLERTARKALEICDGLPLMIKMAANVFKAIEKTEPIEIRWSDGLQTLKRWPEKTESSIMKYMLEFCCDHLNGQQKLCFLYTALHPEDTEISVESLLECWIAENIHDSCDDAKIVGRNILAHLKNVILLEEGATGQFVTMHKVIRDIALTILSEDMKDGCLVRTSEALQRPNDPKRQCVDLWTDKKWISLANDSLNISPDSPHCSKLTTLFVQKYSKQKQIPDSFFQNMQSLLVLNLYKTQLTTLPFSIGKLSSLKVLYLNGCNFLKKLPGSIGNLISLEVLDIRCCGVCELPDQIKGLTGLRRLLVSFTISTQASYDMIFELSGLEELIIDVSSNLQNRSELTAGLVKKFSTMPRVITFQLRLLNEVIDVIQFVGDTVKIYMPTEGHLQSFLERRKDLEKHYFQVFIGCFISDDIKVQDFCHYDRYLKYDNGKGHSNAINKVLDAKVDAFELIKHNDIKNLSINMRSMDYVKCCLIESCDNMTEIVVCDRKIKRPLFRNMERLDAKNLPKLVCIWKGYVPLGSLSKLKTLVLVECPMLTIVFSSNVCNQLRELQHLVIQDCGKVTEIVKCSQDASPYVFLKLTTLVLYKMVSLTKLGFILDWTSLRTLKILGCPTLKEFPFENNSAIMSFENIEIERSWWEALRWPDPEVKEQLELYFSLAGFDRLEDKWLKQKRIL